jgi:hypothetical protein
MIPTHGDCELVLVPWLPPYPRLDDRIAINTLPVLTCSTSRLGSCPARTRASKSFASCSGKDRNMSNSASRSSCLRFCNAVSVSVYWHWLSRDTHSWHFGRRPSHWRLRSDLGDGTCCQLATSYLCFSTATGCAG